MSRFLNVESPISMQLDKCGRVLQTEWNLKHSFVCVCMIRRHVCHQSVPFARLHGAAVGVEPALPEGGGHQAAGLA